MWRSRMFWRLFGTYGVLLLCSIGWLGVVVIGRAALDMHVVGIDHSGSALAVARARFPAYRFIEAGLAGVRVPTGSAPEVVTLLNLAMIPGSTAFIGLWLGGLALNARGLLFGNRGGRFHRDDRTLGLRRGVSRTWI